MDAEQLDALIHRPAALQLEPALTIPATCDVCDARILTPGELGRPVLRERVVDVVMCAACADELGGDWPDS
jgi:hypothetical protein